MGSLILHFVALGAMFLVAFPFSPNRVDQELPVANAQLVGEIDAVPLAPIDLPRASTIRTTPAESRHVTRTVSPEPSVAQLIRPAAMKAPDFSVLGIGGDSGPWSATVASGGELGPDFFGLGGSARGARTIVYVADHSRSMLATLPYVKQELWRSVSALKRSQKFHVIFFSSRMPTEFTPRRFVNAIGDYKKQFKVWLEGIALGTGTEPDAALHRALSMKPDVLYFLTDADGSSFSEALRQKLDRWNKGRRTRIFTVAYVNRSGLRFLETVAREHGGECRYVSDDELPN